MECVEQKDANKPNEYNFPMFCIVMSAKYVSYALLIYYGTSGAYLYVLALRNWVLSAYDYNSV